jgi:hypothetical protein
LHEGAIACSRSPIISARDTGVQHMRRKQLVIRVSLILILLACLYGCSSATDGASRPQTLSSSQPAPTPTISVGGTNAPADVTPTLADVSAATSPLVETGITSEEAQQIVPLQPADVTATIKNSAIMIRWRGTGESIVKYEIRRRTSGGEWQNIGSVSAAGDNKGAYEFQDGNATSGATYIYGVAAVSSFGTASLTAESTATTVP